MTDDNILKRASEIAPYARRRAAPTPGELALALGYCRGDYTVRQVCHAANLSTGSNGFMWVGSVLIGAVRHGMLTENTAGNPERAEG